MLITDVYWSYAESVWQNGVKKKGQGLLHDMELNNTGVLLGVRREKGLRFWPCSPLNFGIPPNPIFTVKLWGHDHKQKFPWSLVKPSCIVPWNSSTQNNSISPAPIKNNGKVSSIVSVWARSGPSLEAVCSSRKKRNLCFSLPLHILCLNLETLPISYSQVDGFHKTDLEFKETFPRCLICCSNERVMLAFTWLIKHTFDQGKLIFVNIMHLPQ